MEIIDTLNNDLNVVNESPRDLYSVYKTITVPLINFTQSLSTIYRGFQS